VESKDDRVDSHLDPISSDTQTPGDVERLLRRLEAAEAAEAASRAQMEASARLASEQGAQLSAAHERLEWLGRALEGLEASAAASLAGETARLREAMEVAERSTAVARAEAASERSLRLHCEAELERRERELRGERSALESARMACGVAHEAGRRAGIEEGGSRSEAALVEAVQSAVAAVEEKWRAEVAALRAAQSAALEVEANVAAAARADLEELASTSARELGTLRAHHEASQVTWEAQLLEAQRAAGEGLERAFSEELAEARAARAALEIELKESRSHARAQAELREREAIAWGEAAEAFEKACETAMGDADSARTVGGLLASALCVCMKGIVGIEGILGGKRITNGGGGGGGGGGLLHWLNPFSEAPTGGGDQNHPTTTRALPPIGALAEAIKGEDLESRIQHLSKAVSDQAVALSAVTSSLALQRRCCAEDSAKVLRLETLLSDSRRETQRLLATFKASAAS